MRQSVIEIFPTFTRPLEGEVLWPYQDVLGLVTVGYGCLIEPVSLALPLKWEGDLSPGQVRAEWAKVNALPKAMHFARYKAASTLRLTEQSADELLDHRMLDFEVTLQKYFPAWDDFPADAQLAAMAMAWACGAGFPKTFTNFTRFANMRDWSGAAKCAAIRTDGNPGIVPRNAQVQLCLANAAAIDDGNFGTPALYWPGPVKGAEMPSTDPTDVPLHVVAQMALAKFSIDACGLTGHAHVEAA